MNNHEPATIRRLRADAAANRARIVEEATAMFREGGQTVSLEAVARKAGVGIATFYRHFASREALAAAVYHREVDELVELADRLASDHDPIAALRIWLRATVEFVATKKGMAAALALSARMPANLTAYSSDRLTAAVERLLDRVTGACRSRGDVSAQDVLRVLVALCYEFDAPDWQTKVGLLLDAFVDGLCRVAPR